MLKETSTPCVCRRTLVLACNFCHEFYQRPYDYNRLSEKHHHDNLYLCKDCELWFDAILEDALRISDGQMPLYLGLFVAMFEPNFNFVRMRLLPLFRSDGEFAFCYEMYNSLIAYLAMYGCDLLYGERVF